MNEERFHNPKIKQVILSSGIAGLLGLTLVLGHDAKSPNTTKELNLIPTPPTEVSGNKSTLPVSQTVFPTPTLGPIPTPPLKR